MFGGKFERKFCLFIHKNTYQIGGKLATFLGNHFFQPCSHKSDGVCLLMHQTKGLSVTIFLKKKGSLGDRSKKKKKKKKGGYWV